MFSSSHFSLPPNNKRSRVSIWSKETDFTSPFFHKLPTIGGCRWGSGSFPIIHGYSVNYSRWWCMSSRLANFIVMIEDLVVKYLYCYLKVFSSACLHHYLSCFTFTKDTYLWATHICHASNYIHKRCFFLLYHLTYFIWPLILSSWWNSSKVDSIANIRPFASTCLSQSHIPKSFTKSFIWKHRSCQIKDCLLISFSDPILLQCIKTM